ncbi:MAG: ATPase, partial [Candidatus Methanomethylophilaceae archaeon]|nr:ATPase [Candidatus Methanomethylophilaceae archaeon]
MDELLNSGIKAIIVGCYAEGLDESWLGRPIDASAAKDLRALRERYGISVIGEGGEYESLTLDSPMHSHFLSIISSEKEWKNNNGTLHVKEAKLIR